MSFLKALKKNAKQRNKTPQEDELVFINKKQFLCENAVHSTSAIHSKLYKETFDSRPKAQLRIADCLNSMRLWNFVDNSEGREDFVEKVDNMIEHLIEYRVKLGDEFSERFNDERFKIEIDG